jgi:acyl homoserine lactone synthase
MKIVSGVADRLPDGLFKKLAQYRYQVFVETLKWPLPVQGSIELDEFDDEHTVYVVSRDEDGDLTGVARLLPTNRPYLLQNIFPQLLNGQLPPNSPDVWELSRFAAVDFGDRATIAPGQMVSSAAVPLLRAAIAYAQSHGAKRMISVSPLGVERLIRRAGIHAHRAGPPIIVDGHPLIACWIELDQCLVKLAGD